VNNSAKAAVINPSLTWVAGGGSACVLDFGGTGNWTVNSNLRDDNAGAGAITLVWDGPGTMTWSTGGVFVAIAPLGPIVIKSGNVILKSSGLALNFTGIATVTNNNSITNNGTLQYDASGQVDTIARDISGTGLLEVSNGLLILTGKNSYTGGTAISGGTLQVGTNGTSGSLGSGPVTNNSTLAFDRSDSVTFTNFINGTGSLVQQGSGTLTLSGANTYTGNTEITNNGTLVVSSVGGGIDVNSGGTLVPIAVGSVGSLNVEGNMNISSGTLLASLNKSLTPSNSFVSVGGTINSSGGKLKLLNFGPSLVVGDEFTIFNQPVGGAMTIVSPGFTVTNNLAVDGSVTVGSVASPGSGQITAAISSGNLNLSWPAAWAGLHLQVQTNSLSIGLGTNWVTIPGTDATNSYSTLLNNSNASVFWRLAP
jgi:fibronectin-binding autotransporter adhesin